MDPLIVVSPHLDDAVLSLGQMMAGREDCVVVTVFAGEPHDPELLAPFDASCGFTSSAEAVAGRRAEDRVACSRLNARPIHLDYLDGQYQAPRPSPRDLANRLTAVWKRNGRGPMVGPLGLAHPDHVLVGDAMRLLPHQVAEVYLYAELPARVLWPEAEAERIATVTLDRMPVFLGTGPVSRKAHAVDAYVSQRANLRLLGDGAGLRCCYVPERVWRLNRP